MTQKRFIIPFENNQNIYDREEKCYYSSIDTKLCDLLNDLEQEAKDNEHYHSDVLRLYKAVSDENAQLKKELEENKELIQFKEQVFNLINKKLEENERELNGVDTAMYYANKGTLNELKKELQDD